MKLSKFCNKISLILQALWCAVLYFLIEALCRHSVVEAWDYMTGKPLVFAYNTMFIFTTMLICFTGGAFGELWFPFFGCFWES